MQIFQTSINPPNFAWWWRRVPYCFHRFIWRNFIRRISLPRWPLWRSRGSNSLCLPSLDHDAFETFDPHPAEIPLNVQIMSRILEDQEMFRFNCLRDLFPQTTISGPFVPIATLFHRGI
jgi:hypothetical protein